MICCTFSYPPVSLGVFSPMLVLCQQDISKTDEQISMRGLGGDHFSEFPPLHMCGLNCKTTRIKTLLVKFFVLEVIQELAHIRVSNRLRLLPLDWSIYCQEGD